MQLWGTCTSPMPAANTLRPSVCWKGIVGTARTTSHSWRMCHASWKVMTKKTVSMKRPLVSGLIVFSPRLFMCLVRTQSAPGSYCVQWQVCSQPEISWPVWRSGCSSAPSTSDTPPPQCTPPNREYDCDAGISQTHIVSCAIKIWTSTGSAVGVAFRFKILSYTTLRIMLHKHKVGLK